MCGATTRLCHVPFQATRPQPADSMPLTLIDRPELFVRGSAVACVCLQLLALDSTIGQAKADIMGARLRDINPDLELRVVQQFLDPDAARSLVLGQLVEGFQQDVPQQDQGREPGGCFEQSSSSGQGTAMFDYVVDCIGELDRLLVVLQLHQPHLASSS